MDKEDLENRFIKLFDLTEGFTANHFKWIINEFFEQNVCVRKGANRHPYADVWHELIENTSLKMQWQDREGGVWNTDPVSLYTTTVKIRIKPSEPVYEYLYYSRIGNTIWSTKDDAPTNMWCAEETKRIRQ